MPGKIIDGKTIAKQIRTDLKGEIESLKSRGVVPGLAAVLVGDDPASHIYVNSKAKACKRTGIYSEVIKQPSNLESKQLHKLIADLNERKDIHGILIQSPLPGHLSDLDAVVNVNPLKDVDGFHPVNMGYMLLGSPVFFPCTPFGIVQLLDRIGVNPKGKKTVILGRGNIVGKPLAVMLMQKWQGCNTTVTVCHTGTADIAAESRQADILIAAMGKDRFVKADMVKEGAVVIDVGMNRVEDADSEKGYKIYGDVDFDNCLDKVSWITPVPGGVGPMTIAMLLYNTIRASKMVNGIK